MLLRLRCGLATRCAAAALLSAVAGRADGGLPMPAGRGIRLPAARLVIDPPLRCAALADALRPARPAAPGEEAALAGLGCVEERALPEGLRPACGRMGRCGDSGSSFLGGGLDSSATLQLRRDGAEGS